ncbi:SDR family NAD(P)-dependent oxidoreductase [Halovulum sp. GXIMD14794]
MMAKTILITGATDGIGLEPAKLLAADSHHLLLHGRNPDKLASAERAVAARSAAAVETFAADLSRLEDVRALAKAVRANHANLDVLINNAGVYRIPQPIAENGQDLRFVVNTVAPYLLTHLLLPLLGDGSRVVNLSSAAQGTVDLAALAGRRRVSDMEAYAQSKLALTMWSQQMGAGKGPVMIAVNPGSLLATKMVK